MAEPALLTEARVQQLLKSWRTLHEPDGLNTLTEGQVKFLIDYESTHEARAVMLLRLHGRYNTLRTRREKAELLSGAKS